MMNGFFVGIGFAVLENLVIHTQDFSSVTLFWAVIRGFASGLMHGTCRHLHILCQKEEKAVLLRTFCHLQSCGGICTVPDSLITLSSLSEDRMSQVLEAIYKSDENTDLTDVKDQFGAVIGKDQFKAAHDDMMKCIGASDIDSPPEYADVIPGFYMYKTVYRAESISDLQSFIEKNGWEPRQRQLPDKQFP